MSSLKEGKPDREFSALIEMLTADTGCGLVVVDPGMNYMVPDASDNAAKDVRAFMLILRRFAEILGCPVLMLRHFGKDTERSPLHTAAVSPTLSARWPAVSHRPTWSSRRHGPA